MAFTSGAVRRRLWPVVGFEHYMLADDTQRHPMVFWLKATFTGRVDRERLKRSLQYTASQQPLLRSRLYTNFFKFRFLLRWREDADTEVFLDVAPKGTPLNFPRPGQLGFDLSKEPGLRLFVREDNESSEWYLQLHHAVTDGTGGLRFLEKLFEAYANGAAVWQRTVADEALPPHAVRRFTRRGYFDLSFWQIVKRLPIDLRTTFTYYAVIPRPLARRRQDSPTALDYRQKKSPTSINYTFSPESTAALKRCARAFHGTLNDLLLRDLFLSLAKFNKSGSKRRTIRLCMPVNMRTPHDDHLPIANYMGMYALDRTDAELRQPHELMTSITTETKRIKSHRLALAIAFVPKLLTFVPGLLTLALKRPGYWKCAATVVLSNLGPSFRRHLLPNNSDGQVVIDHLVLKRLELLPPVKIDTNLAIGVVTYHDAMTLTFHYDPLALSAHDVRTILADYVSQLSDSMMLDIGQSDAAKLSTAVDPATNQPPASPLDKRHLPSLTN